MMQNNGRIKVAVTGGIGSGKTNFCKCLKNLGYPVLSADEIYWDLLKNGDFVQEVSVAMGVEPILQDGKLSIDRKRITELVSDKSMLEKLNSVTHGRIMDRMMSLVDESAERIVFCEVPLLFEGGYETLFDKVIVIERDLESRIISVEKRDGKTRREIENLISAQKSPDYAKHSGCIIVSNNGTLGELMNKAEETVSALLLQK